DGQGRTVDFKNAVIVLTSNIGSVHMTGTGTEEETRKLVMEDLRRAFRPEFLNRLDEIILFHRLSREDVRRIVDVQMDRFGRRLAKKDLFVEVSDRAKDFLANVGYDPIYGARPLKRAIQQHLENPLAQEFLAGKYEPGDVVVVDAGGGALTFTRRTAEEQKAKDEAARRSAN
ncbi:MAG: AAA family ATPase, partial [Myxococcales bacterium]|nr:AAA family ATPase [Myxococcales bacterium]